jgi:glucose uptake protein
MWAASFPLATGMFVGAAILTWVSRGSLRFERQADYAGALLSGLLWGIGNYAMLLLTTVVGTGRGFTLAQLGVVVNATLGILLLKDPRPGSRAATITFIGVVLATLGGMVLGNL